MLREVYIIKNLKTIYHVQFGTSLEWDKLFPIIQSYSSNTGRIVSKDDVEVVNVENFRLTLSFDKRFSFIILFLADLTDPLDDLQKHILNARKEFSLMFEDILKFTDQADFSAFNPIVEMILQSLHPKISLVGFGGVGKTSISKLIRGEKIPMEHIPTITGDILAVRIGKLYFHLWDFAGQEEYSFLWPQFMQDSSAVLIVNDSTVQNIDKSKLFIDLAKKEVPLARLAVIANKQDLPDAIAPEKVERLLDVKTYGMIAIDPENRSKIITIIGELLNISPQLSPLIQPLIERDKAVDEAETLLLNGDFFDATQKFRRIAILSREVGDDKISLEFFERAKRLEAELKAQATAKQEAPPSEPEPERIIEPPSAPPEVKQIPVNPVETPITPKEEVATADDSSKFVVKDLAFNTIDRALDYILSHNYLHLNFKEYDRNQISKSLSNPIPSLSNFFTQIKTQFNIGDLPIFPTLSIPNNKGQPKHLAIPPNSTGINAVPLQQFIEATLTDPKLDHSQKIQWFKDKLASIQQELDKLETNLKQGSVPPKDYQADFNRLRESRRILQEKLSELTIKGLKQFDFSIPP
ncbi:MAG: ADP-ribosylation factor-like protein [Candidatus Helarchaeota archaeon]|nr:ADP-ribosylation factor-like protein [Candidatus Helarchaeota archaeon]